jgi:hypothetical protein
VPGIDRIGQLKSASLAFKAASGIASQVAKNRMFVPYSGHFGFLKRGSLAFNPAARGRN